MLTISGISKAFGKHPVLKDISFSIKNGEIYGLIGKNGAGKTTLMSIIAGLALPDTGSFEVEGQGNEEINIGYLPDIPAFFDYLTSQEYLDFLLKNTKRGCSKRDELLSLVGLTGKEKIKTMSRGMRQRLGVAAALVNEPQVLLLDEPTSALDPLGRHELMEILMKLKNSGKSVLLSTHILADMEKVCDKVGFLHNGIIQQEIYVEKLLAGDQGVWEIMFDGNPVMPSNGRIKIFQKDPTTYLFETTDQKELLGFLLHLPCEIVSIKNKSTSLDDLFEEVCR